MMGLRLLGIVGGLCSSFGLAFSVSLFARAARGPLVEAFATRRRTLDWDLRFIRHSMTAAQVFALQGFGTALLLGVALRSGAWLTLVLLPPLWFAPRSLITRARLSRITAIEGQVDTWMLILANALRATPSLGEALESSARLLPVPLAQELDLALKEHHLGAPLDVALKTMGHRLKSRTVNVALGTLRIARNTGGNLSETLETSAGALREMARLEGVVRTRTAEGKAQAVVIAVMPFPLVGLLNYINPSLLQPLWSTSTGYLLVMLSFVFWLVAIVWARKILAVDI
jgi:tight adherence protein B